MSNVVTRKLLTAGTGVAAGALSLQLNGPSAWAVAGGSNLASITNTAGGNLQLQSALTVASSGNVGVGTPAPAYALDVSGGVRVTGAVFASNVEQIVFNGPLSVTTGGTTVTISNVTSVFTHFRLDLYGALDNGVAGTADNFLYLRTTGVANPATWATSTGSTSIVAAISSSSLPGCTLINTTGGYGGSFVGSFNVHYYTGGTLYSSSPQIMVHGAGTLFNAGNNNFVNMWGTSIQAAAGIAYPTTYTFTTKYNTFNGFLKISAA